MGHDVWERLLLLNLDLNTDNSPRITVANGESCQSIGTVQVPIQLMDRIKLIDIIVMPPLKNKFILGLDFWRIMKIIPNLSRDVWDFSCSEMTVNKVYQGVISSRSDLTISQQRLLDDFVDEGFTLMGDRLGCTNSVEFEIQSDASPIKQRYYPVSPIVQKHIDDELNKMLELGVVEKSTSSWSSPILLVKKKDGGYRFCVDYRKLNSVKN